MDRSEELATRPVGRLLASTTAQTTFAVVTYGIYALTNAWFVSWGVGPLALAGVNLMAPVLLLTVLGTPPEVRSYARDYGVILLAGSVTATGFSALIRAEGRIGYATAVWGRARPDADRARPAAHLRGGHRRPRCGLRHDRRAGREHADVAVVLLRPR